MRLLGLLRRRGLAGTDGPHGFVRDHGPRERLHSRQVQHRVELPVDDLERAIRLALRQRFADTQDRRHAGRENGLFWPTKPGQKRSPLGDLVAQAAEAGRPIAGEGQRPAPLNGYYFKILTAQGRAAPGGAKSYLVKGAMSQGFALVAWPADYDVTGVMTFIIGQDNVARQKDLGPETDRLARAMTAYNPDASWLPVE